MSLSRTAPDPAASADGERRARYSPFRFIKRFLPRGLFGRSLIIIVAPVVLLQGIVSYVFFERDLDTTTRRLARDVAADVAYLIALEDSAPAATAPGDRDLAARMLRYRITFVPGAHLAPHAAQPESTIDAALDEVIERRSAAPAISAPRASATRSISASK